MFLGIRYLPAMKFTSYPAVLFIFVCGVLFCIALPMYAAKVTPVKKEPVKEAEPAISLVERIRLVLKFGNVSQIRDSMEKIKGLKEVEQKSLIPQMKELAVSKDTGIQKALIQLVSDLKWQDLDDNIVVYLNSNDEQIVIAAANVARKKEIKSAVPLLKEKLSAMDYTVSNNHINDLLNAYAGFKDPSMQDFMFTLLKKPEVLSTYKVFILKYLSGLDGSREEIKKYLMEIVANENESVNFRSYAVRALGNMEYSEARDLLRRTLEKLDSLGDMDKKREYFPLRLELISALVKLKDENVKILLIQMTREDDELVRLRAIRKIAEFKSNEFIDLLEYKMKYDSSIAVQKEAKKALDVIQGKSKEISDDGL